MSITGSGVLTLWPAKKGSLYRLIDEYSVFYHRFIKTNRNYTKGIWSQLASGQAYKIWSGFAFEALCLKHLQMIKEALGIGAVYATVSSFRVEGDAHAKGFQLDLIIERNDNSINLCEIKFYTGKFTVTKTYAQKLQERKQRFIHHTGMRKQVFTTLITNNGMQADAEAALAVDAVVCLDDYL